MVMQLPDDKPVPPQPKAPQQQPPQPPAPTPPAPGPMGRNFFPQPTGPQTSDQGTQTLPPDQIGDIPPPPIPAKPSAPIGVSGEQGFEGSTFARPDSRGIRPYQTAGPQRFGPGVPFAGGAGGGGGFGGDEGMGLSPEEAAELLRGLAMGLGGQGNEG